MKTIFTFLLILISHFLFSQDILIFKNGDELECKVESIGIDEITFRKFSNLDGPIYTERKQNIFMIKFENGTKEVFADEPQETEVNESEDISKTAVDLKDKELGVGGGFFGIKYYEGDNRISKNQFKSLIMSDEEAYAQYRQIGTHRFLKGVFNVTAIVSLVVAVANYSLDSGYPLQWLVLGTVSWFASKIANLRIKHKLESAILIYNKNLYKNS